MLNIIELLDQGYVPDGPILLTSSDEENNTNVAKRVATAFAKDENVFTVELSNKNPNDEYEELLNTYAKAINLANEGTKTTVMVNIVGTEAPEGYTQMKLTSLIEKLSFYLGDQLIKLNEENEQYLFSLITKPEGIVLESVLDERLVHFNVPDEQYSTSETHRLK